jgi:phosphatidylinositol glycan class S
MDGFASQLLRLLGAPRVPRSPAVRLDALKRISASRALVGAAASLGSLHRLSQSLPDIAIPKPVFASVDAALEHMSVALSALSSGDWNLAVFNAGLALTSAEAAFFDKMMVQQAFFPSEHNIAIYMPLLGPLAIVMFMGSVRLFKEPGRRAATAGI